MPGLLLAVSYAYIMQKKKKKKIEVSILGWLSNYLLWHCNAFFCFVWLHSLLFLESLVPFLISPYNRIVNLELIKFAAKLLPLAGSQLFTRAFCPPAGLHFCGLLHQYYSISDAVVAMSQHPRICTYVP